MTQTVQEQHVFDTRQAVFPVLDTVFGYVEGTASGVDAQSFVNGGQDLLNTALRRSQIGQGRTTGFREVFVTSMTMEYLTGLPALDCKSCMHC